MSPETHFPFTGLRFGTPVKKKERGLHQNSRVNNELYRSEPPQSSCSFIALLTMKRENISSSSDNHRQTIIPGVGLLSYIMYDIVGVVFSAVTTIINKTNNELSPENSIVYSRGLCHRCTYYGRGERRWIFYGPMNVLRKFCANLIISAVCAHKSKCANRKQTTTTKKKS